MLLPFAARLSLLERRRKQSRTDHLDSRSRCSRPSDGNLTYCRGKPLYNEARRSGLCSSFFLPGNFTVLEPDSCTVPADDQRRIMLPQLDRQSRKPEFSGAGGPPDLRNHGASSGCRTRQGLLLPITVHAVRPRRRMRHHGGSRQSHRSGIAPSWNVAVALRRITIEDWQGLARIARFTPDYLGLRDPESLLRDAPSPLAVQFANGESCDHAGAMSEAAPASDT